MSKIDFISNLIKKANVEFELENFNNSMVLYGLVLNDMPNNQDAIIGIYLSEIGLKDSLKAHIFFDYFIFLKDEVEDFKNFTDNFIKFIEFDDEYLYDYVDNKENFISYKDFLVMLKKTNDIEKFFQNILFSSKIMLKNKEEYISFIKTLILIGQKELATKLLNNTVDKNGLILDQDVFSLYDKIHTL